MRTQFWIFVFVGLISLSFVSCGKKDDNNNPQPVCPPGSVLTNGICTTSPGLITPGNYSSYYTPFIKNGNVTNSSRFRDLVHRTVGYYYRCFYNNGGNNYWWNSGNYNQFGCNDIQLTLSKLNDRNYTVTIRSASYPGSNGRFVSGYIYSGEVATSETLPNGASFALQIYNSNPYRYISMEVILYGNLDQPEVDYEIFFERRLVADGTMRKGFDY